MQPLVPYLLGKKHPLGKRLVNVQRCIRTTDIEEVGNTTHHTFFEMLGNWSLGDYWKEEAIKNTFEFHTKILGIPLEQYAVSCFVGDKNAKKDIESEKIWLSLGIPKERISFLGKEDNWWGPAGKTGPCGPDTEQFYWTGKKAAPKKFDPKNKEWVEIGNDVLMQYVKDEKGKYVEAKQKNVDFGGGVERTVAILNGLEDNYLTEVWQPIIKEIEKVSGKRYKGNEKAMRIIADHIKASVFIIADGITPNNTGQGYVLRRLIRRALKYWKVDLEQEFLSFVDQIAKPVFHIYEKDYEELKKNKKKILDVLIEEQNKFYKTLQKGLKILRNMIAHKKKISSKDVFLLYQSYGFPIELTEEIVKGKIKIDTKAFKKEFQKHQALSKKSAKGKFSSGLADNSEQTTKLHTATHLLNQALRKVLGKDVKQKGSNITSERLRFDFNFPRKLTEKEIKEIEKLVNSQISKGLKVSSEEMSLKKALASGAQSEFGAKYPEIVSVYSIGKFSKEICTGPHVKNTKEIGKFKIKKEKSSSAGVRRIKGVVE
jgi:alanyl-tRNA synthetase